MSKLQDNYYKINILNKQYIGMLEYEMKNICRHQTTMYLTYLCFNNIINKRKFNYIICIENKYYVLHSAN